MRSALLVVFVVACSRETSSSAAPRPEVPAVFDAGAQIGLVAPDPACTCASPESSPAPTPFEEECEGWMADCEDLHYASFDARAGQSGVGVLLATHEVESKVYDATISFPARGGASTMRVSIGDLIPTPRGIARVVQVHRSFVSNWDDGRVTLRFLERRKKPASFVYVSSGAPSRVGDVALTLTRAAGGTASVVVIDRAGERSVALRKGDRVGTARVVEVVDGLRDGTIGWVTLQASS